MERVKEVFCLFDKDGDGFIETGKEFPMALRALGVDCSDKEINAMTDKVELDFAAFKTLADKHAKPKEKIASELTTAFQMFDRDRAGKISAAELRHVLTNLGEALDAEQVSILLKQADPKATGSVDYAAFAKLLAGC